MFFDLTRSFRFLVFGYESFVLYFYIFATVFMDIIGHFCHSSFCSDYFFDFVCQWRLILLFVYLHMINFCLICPWLSYLFAPSLLVINSKRLRVNYFFGLIFDKLKLIEMSSSTASDDPFMDALEDEALVGARLQVELECGLGREGNLEIVRGGGVQIHDTLEKDLTNQNKGELVGSNRCIKDDDDSVAPMYSEWKHSTEAQRDLVAKNLVAVSFFSVKFPNFPNMYVCQIVRARGVVEFVLVANAFSPDSILDALGSRLKNKSVLIWCENGMVRVAAMRMAKRRGVCMAWNVFDPQQFDPPRWPCFRGDSVVEPCEVVKRFLEVLEEWKGLTRVPRVAELEGVLLAEADKWEAEQRWSLKKDSTVPEWPVWMPAKVWGCPLRACFRPPGLEAVRLAIDGEVAAEGSEAGVVVEEEVVVAEEEVVVPMEAEEAGEVVVADPMLAAAAAKVEKMREKRRLQHQRERAKKREAKELVKQAQEKEEKEIMAKIVAKEKEIEEEKARLARLPPKKPKVESRVVAGVEVTAPARTETPIPRRNRPAGRGSGRGNGRGRGGFGRDHGGFRQNQSYEHEDVMRRYRDRTPSLPNTSISLSSSLPSLSLSDPTVLAGLSVLGSVALNRSPVQEEPIATSSPVAFRQPRGHHGGQQRQQSSSRDRQQQGPRHPSPQQQQQATSSAPRSVSRHEGGRGGVPPRQ